MTPLPVHSGRRHAVPAWDRSAIPVTPAFPVPGSARTPMTPPTRPLRWPMPIRAVLNLLNFPSPCGRSAAPGGRPRAAGGAQRLLEAAHGVVGGAQVAGRAPQQAARLLVALDELRVLGQSAAGRHRPVRVESAAQLGAD